jgi:hypothetical protein
MARHRLQFDIDEQTFDAFTAAFPVGVRRFVLCGVVRMLLRSIEGERKSEIIAALMRDTVEFDANLELELRYEAE